MNYLSFGFVLLFPSVSADFTPSGSGSVFGMRSPIQEPLDCGFNADPDPYRWFAPILFRFGHLIMMN
jgi:hypothetical protein